MPRDQRRKERRRDLLRQLTQAGRDLSDAAVMFHAALGERLGLGSSDWKTLGFLERNGPLTAGSLSQLTGLAPASITGILDRLERGGWVRRERDPQDRRRVLVTLEQKAVAQNAAEAFQGLQRRLQELYERYTDGELELLLEGLVEIARRQKDATFELVGDPGEEVNRENFGRAPTGRTQPG